MIAVRFFFKLLFKTGNGLKKIAQWFTILKYKSRYTGRFFCGTKINTGRFFSVYFDTTKSVIRIGHHVQFRDSCEIRSGLNGELKIGDRVFFNNRCSINCFNKITIGNDCQFGEDVRFYDINHEHSKKGELISAQGYSKGSIFVGNNCWIGSNVTILKDVTIGDNVIIGAHSLIYRSIPSNSIVKTQQQQIITTHL